MNAKLKCFSRPEHAPVFAEERCRDVVSLACRRRIHCADKYTSMFAHLLVILSKGQETVRISAPTDHPYRTKLITDVGGN
jgi:hypothetical protein